MIIGPHARISVTNHSAGSPALDVSMEKDVFLTQFDRTPRDTAFFSAVGRSLAFATRFESNCRVIVGVIGLTQGSR